MDGVIEKTLHQQMPNVYNGVSESHNSKPRRKFIVFGSNELGLDFFSLFLAQTCEMGIQVDIIPTPASMKLTPRASPSSGSGVLAEKPKYKPGPKRKKPAEYFQQQQQQEEDAKEANPDLAAKKPREQQYLEIPWFAGCQYMCQVPFCNLLFFYNQDLRNHIKKLHGPPDDYLDQHGDFETKAVYIKCKVCSTEIKRHFSSVTNHLMKMHNGMTLDEYKVRFNMKDYKIPVDHTVDVKELEEKGISILNNEKLS